MSMQLALASPGKEESRTQVAKYFQQKLGGKPARLLSLPGANWYFEKMFMPSRVYGIEERVGVAAAANRINNSPNWHVRHMTMKDYLLEQLIVDEPDTWNCAWLDFCGPMSINIRDTLRAMNMNLVMRNAAIPVAVTLMHGREQRAGRQILNRFGRNAYSSRIKAVSHELGMNVDGGWQYRSRLGDYKGAAMIMLYGTWKP